MNLSFLFGFTGIFSSVIVRVFPFLIKFFVVELLSLLVVFPFVTEHVSFYSSRVTCVLRLDILRLDMG